MKRDDYIIRYISANQSFDELQAKMKEISIESHDATAQNRAKMTHNVLSQEAAETYTVEIIESCFEQGQGSFVITTANQAIAILINEVFERWEGFSFFTRLIVGTQPNAVGAAKWLLATHYTKKQLKKFADKLDTQELDVVMMIYGGLLAISTREWAASTTHK